MKTTKFICGAALLAFAASCAQEEIELNKISTSNVISYKVDTGKMSRGTSAYTKGEEINKITVSAWMNADPSVLPGYGSSNTGNALYFLNDVLTRTEGNTFTYASNARYWPDNGETLDFLAVVDNGEAWKEMGKDGEEIGKFTFNKDGKPGLEGLISQLGLDEMPDLLYATVFNQKKPENGKGQETVQFDFKHAFAKVAVTAEVKNKNIRVVITDMEICGIAEDGSFTLPHKSGEGSKIVINDASWAVDKQDKEDYINLESLLKLDYLNAKALENSAATVIKGEKGEKAVVLDKNVKEEIYEYEAKVDENGDAVLDEEGNPVMEEVVKTKYPNTKMTLISEDALNELYVIPAEYSGRNASTYQTYIKLKAYAYNIADSNAGFDPVKDTLVYPALGEEGELKAADIIIPIEFNWGMGTVNRYNIIFDCGNGGSTDEDPNNPAFIRVGYEVEVSPWGTGDFEEIEYPEKKPTEAEI